MNLFLLILACLLWAGSIFCLYGRQTAAPALSYLGLLSLSFMQSDGFPVLPINNTILIGWLCITLVVIFTSMLQPEPVKRQIKGMSFMIVGGVVGLAVGLLGFSFCNSLPLRYACMVAGVVVGVALGFLLYAMTPDGRPLKAGSYNFFNYLLAKGFPTAITLMMPGIVAVMAIALKNVNAL